MNIKRNKNTSEILKSIQDRCKILAARASVEKIERGKQEFSATLDYLISPIEQTY